MIVATAPTRLDFGGGWTDVPPFPEERGGFVCNIAVDRLATVTLQKGAPVDVSPLVRAALDRSGVHGVRVDLQSDFPVGAGLGGSSAAGVALAAALARCQGRTDAPDVLAAWSRSMEVEQLGIAGGSQDHYAAAFGGALGLSFGAVTTVERIPLSDSLCDRLERQCLLAYSGESRISGTTIAAVLDAYRDRVPRVVDALERMRDLAMHMRDALLRESVDDLAGLVDEHWALQRTLHPLITTPRIDVIEQAARDAGARGVKALGASGGGCVIVFVDDNASERVARALAPFATLLSWRVARRGVHVQESNT